MGAKPVVAPKAGRGEIEMEALAGSQPPAMRGTWLAWRGFRNWELWLALVIGAFLRFWHLDLTSFLVDQNISMRLARTAIVRHLLPVTSVEYSVGGYAPPFGLYLVMPFALFTHDPFPLVISVAVWNVLGIGLCYAFALKYFGRWVAGVGTLLFATCGVAVNYSRFIWQPNYETTFLILWALALFAWCIDGRRRWFAACLVLLVLLLEIIPVTIILVPITAVGWFIAPHRPRGRDYALFGGVLLVVLAPTLLWEFVSGGLDFRQLTQYSGGHATTSLAVFRVLYQTISAPGASDMGPASLYARFGSWYPFISLLAALLIAAGYAILCWRVLAPAARALARAWRTPPATNPGRGMFLARLAGVWRALRVDREWCANLLLWLWVTLPPLSMIRHASPPTVHYLIVMYPAIFLVAAYPVWFLREFDVLRWIAGRPLRGLLGKLLDRRVVAGAGIAVAGLLIAAQATQSALYPASLVSPGFEAMHFYGFPLAEMQAAEQRISALQRQQAAAAIYISLPVGQRFEQGMDYLLVGEHGDRTGYADNCLVLPPPDAPPTLLVSTSAGSPTAALLPALANAQRVSDIPMVGGEPFQIYRVSGAVPALPGETALAPAVYQATPHNALRLDAAAVDAPGMLRLRWTVLAAAQDAGAPEVYHLQARAAEGNASADLGVADCQPTHWQAGQTVFTWLSLAPATATSGPANTAPTTLPPSVALSVSASAPHLYTPMVGPLHLMSAHSIDDMPALLQPVPAPGEAPGSRPGSITANGSYVLPVQGTS